MSFVAPLLRLAPVFTGYLCKSLFRKSLFGLIPLMLAGSARGDVTLQWDPEPDASGYRLYYGTVSGDYTQVLDAGKSTVITVPDVVSTVTYYFAVTTYDLEGIESEPSEELPVTIAAPAAIGVISVDPGTLPEGVTVPAGTGEIAIHATQGALGAGEISGLVTSTVTVAVSIDSSTDLVNWVSLGTVLNPTGALRFSGEVNQTTERRYYRAREVDVPVIPGGN